MSTDLTTFEVRVKIRGDKPICWHPRKDMVEYGTITKTYHIEASKPDKAIEKAERKYGRVISCRKANYEKIIGDVSNLPLKNTIYVNRNPYPNAIAMDEMIWNKNKRAERLHTNKQKDKLVIDNGE